MALVLLCVSVAARDTVNFDFAWRHKLGPTPAPGPSPRQKNCTAGEEGVNYGWGGSSHSNVSDVGACCALCAAEPTCGCWDLNVAKHICWIKSDCSQRVVQKDRTSARLPLPPGPTPPAALPGFDDSAWQVVDAPHDMLIHQDLNEHGDEKMAFYDRNVGW